MTIEQALYVLQKMKFSRLNPSSENASPAQVYLISEEEKALSVGICALQILKRNGRQVAEVGKHD